MKNASLFPLLAAVCGFVGCQTTPLPDPEIGGHIRTGQMRYSSAERSFVGEFSMRVSPGEFQLDVSKGPGVTVMSLREVARAGARVEGGGRTWQGAANRAPKAVQSWLALDDVFAGRPGDGSWTATKRGAQTTVHFPVTGERFVFHFNSPST